MPSRYEMQVTRGAIRLVRRWEAETYRLGDTVYERQPTWHGGGTSAGRPGLSTAGRRQSSFSERSRRQMRFEFSALPWERLGDRPAMVTLTYPAAWRSVAPDARAVVAHREALKERWRRRFGAPVGVWVMEFQPRKRRPEAEQKAPHVHLYVALPDEVSDDEYGGYVARTLKRRRDERRLGKFEARRRMRAPEGDFAEWLLRSWYEVVGSGDRFHRRRGVDITAQFWSPAAAETADRTKIGDYFWRESGKWGQKTPPENFGGLKFYGRWGRKQGFEPLVGARELDARAMVEIRRVLRRYVDGEMRRYAIARGLKVRRYRGPRGRDGLTAFMRDGVGTGGRLYEWAVREAAAKRASRE